MLAHSFFIALSSKLLVTRTDIKALVSLISGQIRLLKLELFALEEENFPLLNLNISEASRPDWTTYYGVSKFPINL